MRGDSVLERFLYYFSDRVIIDRFTEYLLSHINLRMIEFMKKRKDLRGISRNKEWKQLLADATEELLPQFTYRQWKIILSLDHFYMPCSENKDEDIRKNLTRFLESHYLELYKLFDVRLYKQFQKKKSTEIFKIFLVQNAYFSGKKADCVFILYFDGSRIGYQIKTKQRAMMELVEIQDDTLIITLVRQGVKEKKNFLQKLLELL